MSEERLREVIREPAFEDELHVLISRNPREADEFIEGAEYILARNPESGIMALDAPPLWFMPMAAAGGKQVTLYYTFDETSVLFVGIRIEP